MEARHGITKIERLSGNETPTAHSAIEMGRPAGNRHSHTARSNKAHVLELGSRQPSKMAHAVSSHKKLLSYVIVLMSVSDRFNVISLHIVSGGESMGETLGGPPPRPALLQAIIIS
eukprot:11249511-Heterocapsa_arctica.AAC.1